MLSRLSVLSLCAVVLCVGASHPRAETVVLRDGTVLQGKVETTRTHVRISSEDGVLELPRWQVRQILARRYAAATTRPPAADGRTEATRAASGLRSAEPEVLRTKLSVDFDRVHLQDALKSVEDETQAKIRLVADVPVDDVSVDLQLEDVPLKQVLESLLAPRDLAYAVTADGTIWVGKVRPVEQPATGNLLEKKISVDFDDVPVRDVLVYIRETTGIGLALHADVGAPGETVKLHLNEVPLRRVLHLILPPLGYRYTVYPDDVLYVRRRLTTDGYVMRVYQVTDLLLSLEDVTGGSDGGRQGGGGLGSSRRGGQTGRGLTTPQFGGRRPAASGHISPQFGGQGRGGGQDGEEDYGFSDMTDRAQNLVLLIKQACGRGTWMSPASTGLIDVGAQDGGGRDGGTRGAGYGFGAPGM